jgi:adenosylhomocysteine nucleosidase
MAKLPQALGVPRPVSAPVSVAFVCAMPMELRPLAKRLRLRRSRAGDIGVRSGTARGRAVLAVATGMGTALATDQTQRLLAAIEVGHVIIFGIAGAVGDGIALGTVIRPRAVVDGTDGAEHVPAPLRSATPGGTIWTTDELITNPDVLSGLRSRGVVALDMETAAIAAVCERHGVGWSAVRVISDRAADGVVTDEVFRLSKQDGTPDVAAVTRYFARHPGHVPRMARLASAARKATAIAADAAIGTFDEIAPPTERRPEANGG